MSQELTLDSSGPCLADPGSVQKRSGFGGKFARIRFGSRYSVGDISGAIALVLDIGGDMSNAILEIVQDHTEPTVIRVTCNGVAVPLEGNVDSVSLRVKNTRTGVMTIDNRSIPTGAVTDTNAVTVAWLAADWVVPGQYWLELNFVFSAGFQRAYRNQGSAIVHVEEKVAA